MRRFLLVLLLVQLFTATSARTQLSFSRALDTCDVTSDLKIASAAGQTSRLVWAYSNTSPSPHLSKHDAKGSISLNLHSRSPPASTPANGSSTSLRLLLGQQTFPASRKTTYWCRGFTLPASVVDVKHHLTRAEPVWQGEGVSVHHMLLYECEEELQDGDLEYSGQCYSANMPPRLAACNGATPVVGWAVGGGAFEFPPQAGFPVGGADGPRHFLLEVHYDNPSPQASGTVPVPSAGFDVSLTTALRQYDAGVLNIGRKTATISIPAGQEAYALHAECPGACFDSLPFEGITIYSSLLHMHTVGAAVHVEHIRNNSVIRELDRNDHYDFNYQQTVQLPEPVTVLPGDSFRVTCVYDTSGRISSVSGGLSTDEEMCLSYHVYYPRHPDARRCVSNALDPSESRSVGVECPAGVSSFTSSATVTPLPDPPACSVPAFLADPNYSPDVQIVTSADGLSTSNYSGSATLDTDGRVRVHWAIGANPAHGHDELRVLLDVDTDGWVGVGVSPTGGMVGSDVVIGWVSPDDGTAHVSDRFASAHSEPTVDSSQAIYDVQLWRSKDSTDSSSSSAPAQPSHILSTALLLFLALYMP